MFHRLTAPTYFGGLPGGYDYLNNLLAGTPAFVDGAKAGGPNAGTYFVALGEDATSADFNRGHGALAQNTDILDDLLHRDVATVVRTTSAAGPVTDVILTGPGIFLGTGSSVLKDLFRVVGDNGENIVDPATGIQCVIDAIDAGGALGSGYSAGSVTISIDPPVPAMNFRVVYALRANLATANTDALAVPVRSDVDYNARLWHLQASGIDSRYRRSVTGTLGALGVAGSGGTYFRDGPSMKGYGQVDLTGSTAYNAGIGSWLEGLWVAENNDFGGREPTGGENPFGFVPPPPANDRFGGTSSGFVYFGQQRFSQMLAETSTHRAPGFASFYHGAKHYDDGAADAEMNTWLPAGTVVSFTGDAITVGAPAFFRSTPNGVVSAIALDYDLIDLDFGDGVVRSFILSAFTSDLICTVKNLDFSTPNVPAATPATIVRWLKTRFGVFDGAKEAWLGYCDQGTAPYGLAGLVHISGAFTTLSGNNTLHGQGAQFYGCGSNALVWGGFDPTTSTMLQLGFLGEDGGVNAQSVASQGFVSGSMFAGGGQTVTAGGIARTVNFMAGHKAHWDTPAGAGVTLTVTVASTGVGYGILSIKRGADAFTTLAVTSPAHSGVKIRSGDTALGAAGAGVTTIYIFESISTASGQVLYVYKLGAF